MQEQCSNSTGCLPPHLLTLPHNTNPNSDPTVLALQWDWELAPALGFHDPLCIP